MSSFHLVLTSNGPGELSNWVKPICSKIATDFPFVKVTLYLVPCQLASGNEYKNASQMSAISTIFTAKETVSICLGLKKVPAHSKKGAVLYLGGDHSYAKRLAKRYQYPVYAYSHTPIKKGFEKVFVRSITQDLMAESRNKSPLSKLEACKKLGLDPQKNYLLFFTGSRPKQTKYLIPYFIDTFLELKKTQKDYEAILSVSPFSDQNLLKPYLDKKPEGLHFLSKASQDLYAVSELLITIPGTNTAEAMYAKVPMYVCLPVIYPEVIDYPGILGLLVKIPVINTVFFKIALWYFKATMAFFALPNMLLKRKLVPEPVGYIYPKDMAKRLDGFLNNPNHMQEQKEAFSSILKNMSSASEHMLSIIVSGYEKPNVV